MRQDFAVGRCFMITCVSFDTRLRLPLWPHDAQCRMSTSHQSKSSANQVMGWLNEVFNTWRLLRIAILLFVILFIVYFDR